eukprot:TRINITY_DN1631_c4_g1_i1.p1 TRINITY_DN1631_c4_g1~~TRINITY_DN1631_c4_g1_i1.p1  ORF type:complete len:514 (+),score=113.59 TRINITY_DN1631_c4_g1_i1:46-1542(+)
MLTTVRKLILLGFVATASAQCGTCPAGTECNEINKDPSIYRCTDTCSVKTCPAGTTCEVNPTTKVAECVGGSSGNCGAIPCPDYTKCEYITNRGTYSCMETCELVTCPPGQTCFMNTTVGEAQCEGSVSTAIPTASPTANPTASPTANPTASPTANPTASPTISPTVAPTTLAPTDKCGTCPTDTVCRLVGVMYRCVETCAIKTCPAQTKCITTPEGIAECIGTNSSTNCNPDCQDHMSCQFVTRTNKYTCMETCDLVSKTCLANEVCEMDTTEGITKCVAIATPTAVPTMVPGTPPTATPTMTPGTPPTAVPTMAPGTPPTATPTMAPGTPPTAMPTMTPGVPPTAVPTMSPGTPPTATPTMGPGTPPTVVPTMAPGIRTLSPTYSPGTPPTEAPPGTTIVPGTTEGPNVNPSAKKSSDDGDSLIWLWVLLAVLGVLLIGGGVGAYLYFQKQQKKDDLENFLTQVEGEDIDLPNVNDDCTPGDEKSALISPTSVHRF